MDTHFIQTSTPEPLIERLVTTINDTLSNDTPVAWFLSGGSAIAIAVAVAQQILAGEPRQRLRILQIDERFGPVGHPDSNWKQLLDAGFRCDGATYRPILHGQSLNRTINTFEETLQDALNNCKLRIGLFGIGPDGHTAGILPGSSATAETTRLAVGYQGPDYIRITMTPLAITHLDLAVAFAGGEAKRDTLQQLRQDVPLPVQPAQVIKRVAQWYVYSDVLA